MLVNENKCPEINPCKPCDPVKQIGTVYNALKSINTNDFTHSGYIVDSLIDDSGLPKRVKGQLKKMSKAGTIEHYSIITENGRTRHEIDLHKIIIHEK